VILEGPTGKQRFEFEIGRETARASTNQRKVPSRSVQISLVNICSVSVSSFSRMKVFSFSCALLVGLMNDPLIYVVPTGLIRNAKMSGAKGIRGKKGVGASFN